MCLVGGGMSITWAEVTRVLHEVCEGGDGHPGDCVGVSLQWSKSGRRGAWTAKAGHDCWDAWAQWAADI